jgi:hypothetical protein
MSAEHESVNPFHGTDLWRLARGLNLLHRIQEHLYPDPDLLEWILPPDVLPGVTRAWNLPVRRVDGIPGPYLAIRVEAPS